MREDRFFDSSWHFLGTYYVLGTMSNLHIINAVSPKSSGRYKFWFSFHR